MSYEPTNWKTGDVVTSQKLNKLEQGVAGAGGGYLKITIDGETGAMDKTWQEIHDAFKAGYYVSFLNNVSLNPTTEQFEVSNITGVLADPTREKYDVFAKRQGDDAITFSADTASDYPVYVSE